MEATLAGVAWFATSAVFSTWANTAFLQHFDSTMGHTVVRFVGAALLSALALGPRRAVDLLRRGLVAYLLPAACLFMANFANSIALANTGITLTYVVKSAIPVFTVVVCVLQGQRFPTVLYLTLVPTVLGVSLASAADVDFDAFGLLAALVSTMAQTMLNIQSKKTAELTKIKGFESFLLMSSGASLLCLPLFLCLPGPPVLTRVLADGTNLADNHSLILMLAAALAYQFEYALNFVFSSHVDPVTFAVADIGRRLAIIVTGAVVFSKPLTPLNIAGCLLALAGVMSYNLVNMRLKHQEAKAQLEAPVSPASAKLGKLA